jgi:hypothetical protein
MADKAGEVGAAARQPESGYNRGVFQAACAAQVRANGLSGCLRARIVAHRFPSVKKLRRRAARTGKAML